MARDYAGDLFHAKQKMLRAVCDTKGDNSGLAGALDDLNKAWDNLTDCLVRQRTELQEQVVRLINDLAEAKKGK